MPIIYYILILYHGLNVLRPEVFTCLLESGETRTIRNHKSSEAGYG